jgi:hypothetical protein
MVECLRRAVDEVARAELEESASLSVPRDRETADGGRKKEEPATEPALAATRPQKA